MVLKWLVEVLRVALGVDYWFHGLVLLRFRMEYPAPALKQGGGHRARLRDWNVGTSTPEGVPAQARHKHAWTHSTLQKQHAVLVSRLSNPFTFFA